MEKFDLRGQLFSKSCFFLMVKIKTVPMVMKTNKPKKYCSKVDIMFWLGQKIGYVLVFTKE